MTNSVYNTFILSTNTPTVTLLKLSTEHTPTTGELVRGPGKQNSHITNQRGYFCASLEVCPTCKPSSFSCGLDRVTHFIMEWYSLQRQAESPRLLVHGSNASNGWTGPGQGQSQESRIAPHLQTGGQQGLKELSCHLALHRKPQLVPGPDTQ